MSLKKLLAKKKEIEIDIEGEKVKFEIVKPNQLVWEKVRKKTQVEIAKLKMSDDLKLQMEAEVAQMSDTEVIESLATIQLTVDMLKAGIRLQEEKFKELDEMRAILDDKEASEETKKKAQEYIDKYQNKLQSEIERLMEAKKLELKNRPIESLRDELIREKIKTEAETQAFINTRLYQVGELCYYEGKKLSEHPDFEEFLLRVDDTILSQLISAIDEMTLGGIDIKKSLSQMNF